MAPTTTPANLIVRACLLGVAVLLALLIVREMPQFAKASPTVLAAGTVAVFYVPIIAAAGMGFQEFRQRSKVRERSTPISLIAACCLVGASMHGTAWIVLATIHDDTGEAVWLRWGVLTVVYFVPIGCAAHLGYQRSRRQLASHPAEPAAAVEALEPWVSEPSPSDNPYQAPQVAEGAIATVAATDVSREELRAVAARQKAILYCLVAYLSLIPIALIAPRMRLGIPMVWLPILGVSVQLATAICLGRLATRLHGVGLGILFGVLGLIPWISLVFLFYVNRQATKLLKRHGISVGLMGANPDEI